MMEIAHEPYKKISFRSYLEYDTPEKLAGTIAMNAPANVPAHITLRWANGVVFSVIGFQPNDSMTKENIAGHLMWDHIDFAIMPEYRSEIRLPDKPLVTFGVLDLSGHPLFELLCEWIKEHLAKKKAPLQARRRVK
jgi:hypothetical protein